MNLCLYRFWGLSPNFIITPVKPLIMPPIAEIVHLWCGTPVVRQSLFLISSNPSQKANVSFIPVDTMKANLLKKKWWSLNKDGASCWHRTRDYRRAGWRCALGRLGGLRSRLNVGVLTTALWVKGKVRGFWLLILLPALCWAFFKPRHAVRPRSPQKPASASLRPLRAAGAASALCYR